MGELPITPTGETHEGLPVFRMGTPERDAARERRDQSIHAVARATSRGEPITRAMVDEMHAAKVELFRVTGRGEPRLRNHIHTRECYDDPGPGHGSPSLICGNGEGDPEG